MKNIPVILTILSVTVLIMISCSLIGVLSPAPAAAAIPTGTATVTATVQPTPTPLAQQATSTPTRPRVVKTSASNVPISTPITASTPVPCNKATLVADVTVPDGTVVHPGDPVVKTWRLMNAGSCTWTTAYKLVFDRGYDLVSARSVNLARPVAPGETADISLNFTAPTPLGNYESYWNLQGPAGVIFGVGPNGAIPLDIRISIQPKPKK